MSSKDFTREEYQEVSGRAVKQQKRVKNSYWKRAYLRLADAANTLDAMEARTEESVPKNRSKVKSMGMTQV